MRDELGVAMEWESEPLAWNLGCVARAQTE